jgi:hypothetical protein
MILLAAMLLLAQAAAPTPEPQGELPAGASVYTRKKPGTHLKTVEGHLVTPGRDVSADDVVDEMVDEFAADVARLGAARVSPILIQRVRVSENMNPEYGQVLEARLAAAVFRAANVALVRCVECGATRSRVEGAEWVVTRGVTTREQAREVARKYGARSFLDISLSLREYPASLAMDVEMVRTDDSSIAFAEAYRMDADQGMLYRGADRAQTREDRLKELEDKLEERPRYTAAVEFGTMMVPSDPAGSLWGAVARYRLTEKFGWDRQYEAGLTLGGYLNDTLIGGMVAAMFQVRIGDGNIWSSQVWLGADAGGFLTGNAGNTAIFGPTLRWQIGTRIGLHAAIRYMPSFSLKGKTDEFGGVTPELGVGFTWN